MSTVEFRAVAKRYGKATRAVRDFSLTIGDGEFVVLVGPSGCGKSTLMRMLAGLESVTAGEILIDGDIVNDWTPQRRNVAMVFQDYALYPHLNVHDNLAFPLRMRKARKADIARRVEEAADLLDLNELMTRLPAQLSGGQRQRVAMGRAMVRDPSVFLMDEPLSNLDARLRAQIRTEINTLRQRLRKTTLYVTHDQVEAMTLGDRVCVMNHGVLQQVATPMTLYEQPANTFVAGFLGSPGMNLLAMRLRDADATGLQLTGGCGRVRMTRPIPALPSADGYMIVGVRPEALKPGQAPSDHMLTLRVRIDSAESLGHEILIYGTPLADERSDHASHIPTLPDGVPTDSVVARLPAYQPVEIGSVVDLHAAIADLTLFDTQGQHVA